MAPDGVEVRCRLNNQAKPSGSVLVIGVFGTVEQDQATICCDSPILEIGAEIDLQLLNEAINLQFSKPFQHLYLPGVSQATV